MTDTSSSIGEFHWLLGILQHVDVGLVVLDRQNRVQLWNGFMENHSGIGAGEALGADLFQLFPDIPASWLQRKIDSVFLLNNRAFTTWQQRPYLFRFENYRPITGGAEWMFQNVTLFPLASLHGTIDHVCLLVYDVTDMALDELALQEANAELERLGRTDGLTGLENRRSWEQRLRAEYKRDARSGQPCSLVMFDIDHFKQVNDSYGHQVGDEVIRRIADTLRAVARDSDIAGRYGGEEFAVILPDTDADGALRFAERLRTAVAALDIEHEDGVLHCSVSLGVALLEPTVAGPEQWLERADQALYRSKHDGRNRATLYGDARAAGAG